MFLRIWLPHVSLTHPYQQRGLKPRTVVFAGWRLETDDATGAKLQRTLLRWRCPVMALNGQCLIRAFACREPNVPRQAHRCDHISPPRTGVNLGYAVIVQVGEQVLSHGLATAFA